MVKGYDDADVNISTHSPTRGLTGIAQGIRGAIGISTHSPTRGLTQQSWQDLHWNIISTHSPTRGLTLIFGVSFPAHVHFNSQPHKGADDFKERFCLMVYYFNSQPHKGADLIRPVCSIQTGHFNSQPHKGADRNRSGNPRCNRNFNSQPHKGADTALQKIVDNRYISTHSPTRGLTRIWSRRWEFKIFQLTAPQGG